jgi:hypothetical protein
MMALRLVVIVLFIAILVSLGQALYLLAVARPDTTPERSRRLGRALMWRVLLSIGLFALLLLAWRFGLIAPHELGR